MVPPVHISNHQTKTIPIKKRLTQLKTEIKKGKSLKETNSKKQQLKSKFPNFYKSMTGQKKPKP